MAPRTPDSERFDGRRDRHLVARARTHVEDDAADRQIVPVHLAAEHDSCGRLRLRRDVEHQDDRPAGQRGEVRGGAACALAAGRRAVEQAHDAFDHAEIRVGSVRGDKRVDELRAHRPRIEVDALTSGGRRMEGRVDIVGSALERLDGDALVAQRAQQAERQRRLAGAGACGGYDDAPRPPPAHVVAPARLASNSVRKAAMQPTTTTAGAPMLFALASSAAR